MTKNKSKLGDAGVCTTVTHMCNFDTGRVLTNKNLKNQYYNTYYNTLSSSQSFQCLSEWNDPLRILLAEDIKFLYDPQKTS